MLKCEFTDDTGRRHAGTYEVEGGRVRVSYDGRTLSQTLVWTPAAAGCLARLLLRRLVEAEEATAAEQSRGSA